MIVETIRFTEESIELIDQRLLPQKYEYFKCLNASDVTFAIKQMVVRGAPAIGVAVAYGIARESKNLQNLSIDKYKLAMDKAFNELANSRPTAVNLFWALEKMRTSYQNELNNTNINLNQLSQKLISLAHQIHNDDILINQEIGKNGAKLLPQKATILTHCNAGALATAGYGTALGVIRAAVEQGKDISVIADETRPLLQGARLTAWELLQEKIPTTLITDNMAGFMINQNEIDAVIVGTDRVAANGDVANKIGTFMVAVLAKYHNIPFYVACPISTIDINTPTGKDIPIEERNPDEVYGYANIKWTPDEIKVRNPAFDVTPANLVTAIITEKGVISKPNTEKIKDLLDN